MPKKKKNIVVIGSNSRLGKAIINTLSYQGYNVVSFNSKELNLEREDEIKLKLNELDYDCLICCAALTSVDYAEECPEKAYSINADSLKIIAEISNKKNAKLIHISTDYVFLGEKDELKEETQVTNPKGVYGLSKLKGEQNVLEVNPNFIIVRVSWLFGPGRDSFADSIIKQIQTKEEIEVISDKYSIPSYTVDLAEYIVPLIDDHGGIFHLCNSGSCSWHEYALGILEISKKLGLEVKCKKILPVTLSKFTNFKAPRPKYTSLSTKRYQELTGIVPRNWRSAMTDYIKDNYLIK